MEIDTTKIGKHFISSPTIDVNNLRAYNDIVVSGTSFRELFDGTEIKFVDTRDLLKGNSYTSEQIHAFKCDVSDYIGGKFKSVTLRHDSSTNTAEAGRSEVWLFVTIFDENSNIIDTFFSTNKAQQQSVSTTWLFDSIEIKNNYKIFEFRMTSTEGVANRNPNSNSNNLRSFSIKDSSGTKILLENWTTVEQNGVEKSYTTDCFLEIEVNRLNIKSEIESIKNNLNTHISSENIHLNNEDINSLIQSNSYVAGCITMCNQLNRDFNTHFNDSNIHLTSQNVNDAISSHISSSPHLSENEIRNIINNSSVKSDLDTHKSQTDIHLTSEDVSNLISTSDIATDISVLNEGLKINESVINNFINDKLPLEYDVCFEETANHYIAINEEIIESFAMNTSSFVGTYITSVSIRKKQGDTYNQLPLATTPAWLYATCFDENNNIIKVIFSSNNSTQNPNETITTWNFENFFITSNIKTIEYSISFTNGVQEKKNKIRSASIRANGNKITKNGWYTIDGASNKVSFITDTLIKYNCPSHSSQKTYHLSTMEVNDELDNYSAKGFQLGRIHIKPGKIKKIIIPYNSSSNEHKGTFYLALQIFKKGDVDTSEENKSKEETHYSLYPSVISSNSNGYYTFLFDNLEIPEDFHFVRFLLTTSKDVVPNGVSMTNCGNMRLRPIKRNNDFLNFDIDECCIISSSGQKLNYLVACDFIYENDIHQKEKYFSQKWRLEFNGIQDYIKNIFDDVSNLYYMSINASKITKNDFDLSTLTNNENTQDIIIVDINFGVSVSNEYVEKFIKGYSTENLPIILPIF